MKSYLELLSKIKNEGTFSVDRTGIGRHRIFGTQTRYDLSDGTLPVVTTRKIYTDAIIKELLWFIKGSFNNKELTETGVKIWNHWVVGQEHIDTFAKKYAGDNQDLEKTLKDYWSNSHLDSIGEMYGAMWRNAPRKEIMTLWPDIPMEDFPSDKIPKWTAEYEEIKSTSKDEVVSFETYCKYQYYQTVDQLNELVLNLKKRPYSSRLLVTAWVPSHVPFEQLTPQENVLLGRGSLAACHAIFQCFATPPEKEGDKPTLSLMMTQRSVDMPVGACYNIAQYSLLLALLAHCTDMTPGEFIWSTGDTHIYSDQMDLVDTQLCREPFAPPKLWINPDKKDLFSMTFEDIKILDYQHHSHIPYPVAI